MKNKIKMICKLYCSTLGLLLSLLFVNVVPFLGESVSREGFIKVRVFDVELSFLHSLIFRRFVKVFHKI